MPIVHRDGIAFAIGRDGGFKRFDRSECTSYVSSGFVYKEEYAILHHHNPSGAWILEDAGRARRNRKPTELSDVEAVEWIVGNLWADYESDVDRLWALFPKIREFTKVPTTERRVRIIKKCKCCLERERRARSSIACLRSSVDLRILEVLRASDRPLIGKEIALKAKIKPNAHFRARLAKLKECGSVVKIYGKGGYVVSGSVLS